MTNLNKLQTSVEQMSTNQELKVAYIDEASFCLVHKPTKTETWKQLNEKFSERREVEKEKLKLKTERYELSSNLIIWVKNCGGLWHNQ